MIGMVLLTGGKGRRLGGPKHARPHPGGGSWGGHLVRTFRAVFPGGPVHLLGEALEDAPADLVLGDGGEGPAVALARWTEAHGAEAERWWVVACDQVRWDPARLEAWFRQAEAADPGAGAWVVAEAGGRRQYLGGFLAGTLAPRLAALEGKALRELLEALPHVVVQAEGPEWADVDTPEELRAWGGA